MVWAWRNHCCGIFNAAPRFSDELAVIAREAIAGETGIVVKQSTAILEAEGRLEASKRDAEAQVVLAQASQTAITKVTEAIKDKELPAMYLLGEKYIATIQDLSASDNAKTILLPADLPAAIRGMLGGK